MIKTEFESGFEKRAFLYVDPNKYKSVLSGFTEKFKNAPEIMKSVRRDTAKHMINMSKEKTSRLADVTNRSQRLLAGKSEALRKRYPKGVLHPSEQDGLPLREAIHNLRSTGREFE